jgi:selenocysteine lyase/cysteine desulfurase
MRNFFPSLNKYKKIIFADNAGGSQLPYQVIHSLNKFIINNYVQPIGNNNLSYLANNSLKTVKNTTNILLNNKKGEIIYGNSCSQLSYNLANSLENYLKNKKGEIILTDFSHEACITPFERIANNNNLKINWWSTTNNINNKYKIDYNSLISKVNNNTNFVVLPHVSNILGNIVDIKYLASEIKKKNIDTKILVDGVAYMPHGLIDVDDCKIDYYIVSFYKFCGLRISALYSLDGSLNNISNQNHYFFNNLNNNFSKKLEIGGYNYECASSILGLKEYLLNFAKVNNVKEVKNNSNEINSNEINSNENNSNQINSNEIKFNRKLVNFVMNNIYNYEKNIVNKFKNTIDNMKNIEIIECNESDKIPIFSLKFKDYNENNVNLILNSMGILTSNGTFYCNRFFEVNKLDKNNGVLRISLMHYNNVKECNKILDTLKIFEKINSNFEYKIDSKLKNNICNDLKNSFNDLKIDKYYENKRLRAYSLLDINNINNINIMGDIGFYQADNYNNYNGNILRNYSNISKNILNNNDFKYLIKTFKQNALETMNIKINYLQIHQIRVYASETNINLVPEGIHQDGYNIIGMICINRHNIKGAISNIYDNNKNKIHNVQLEMGEMLILNDNKLFHDVTSIELNNKQNQGYRDVFVFTSIS